MTRLTYKEKKSLPTSTFVLKKERKYPIPDVTHARNALARASQFGSPTVQGMVKAEVKRRFPTIKVAKK